MKSRYIFKRVYVVAFILLMSGLVFGQSRQADSDSLTVTTSADSTRYNPMWETASIKFVGCDGLLKFAISRQDTIHTDKTWYSMTDGSSLDISRNRELGIPGVYKVWYKAASGTGALHITGTKTSD